jgi:hypothetical protein
MAFLSMSSLSLSLVHPTTTQPSLDKKKRGGGGALIIARTSLWMAGTPRTRLCRALPERDGSVGPMNGWRRQCYVAGEWAAQTLVLKENIGSRSVDVCTRGLPRQDGRVVVLKNPAERKDA